RATRGQRAGGSHRRRAARRPTDRRTAQRGPHGAGGVRGLRGRVSVERAAPSAVTAPRRRRSIPARWGGLSGVLFAVLFLVVWLVVTDAPSVRFVVRLYRDKHFLKETVASWGWMAPLVFIAIQALQVIISPIPGEITGPAGGALFGTWWGLIYSSIGLTAGARLCLPV